MQIDIGEQLIYSWLRHVKGCQIVQLNWEYSPSWKCDNENIQAEMEHIKNECKNRFGLDIFRNGKKKEKITVDQIIQQAEIDAIGIFSPFDSDSSMLYAVDVAVHANGLGYESTNRNKSNAETVIEKMARAAICIHRYFGNIQAKVIFATPKIRNKSTVEILEAMRWLNNHFIELKWKIECSLIVEERFKNEIFDPTKEKSNELTHTSELFSRFCKLFTLAPYKPKTGRGKYRSLEAKDIARVLLVQALEEGRVDQDKVLSLLDPTYSKDTFEMDFPILSRTSDNGQNYLADAIKIRGEEYFLCKNWEKKNRDNLIEWLEDPNHEPTKKKGKKKVA